MENIAEKFIEALRKLEADENLDEIVDLFADDCQVGNITIHENLSGKDGAREFWTHYRKTFGEIRSEFKNKITSDGAAALEWTSTGTSANGSEINYEGVSILEADGDRIRRFFAYFNPAKLGHEIEVKKNG